MPSSPSLVALHGYHSGPSYCLRSQYVPLVLVNGVDADAPSNASRVLAPEALRGVGGIMVDNEYISLYLVMYLAVSVSSMNFKPESTSSARLMSTLPMKVCFEVIHEGSR